MTASSRTPLRAPATPCTQGEVLATLEDRDLLLERLKWVTERQQHMFEYDKALASRQPAAINVIRSQIDQAEAQIKLLDEQLARIKLRSPIDGLVVSGDLSQLIGASVQRGQVLFEVAPLDGYRVILDVDEREIGAVEAGPDRPTGRLRAAERALAVRGRQDHADRRGHSPAATSSGSRAG